MLLLKGDKGKSVVVNIIGNSSYSDIIVYDDGGRNQHWNNIFLVDTKYFSLEDLKEYLLEKHRYKEDNTKDFLIIYTNIAEEEIVKNGFIEWLNNRSANLNAREIILTCR